MIANRKIQLALASLIIGALACNFPGGDTSSTGEASPSPPLDIDFPSPIPTEIPPTSAAAVTPTPALLNIGGILWHETCEFTGGEGGEPIVLGEGCVQYGDEAWEYGPNQIIDPFESGWDGVTLHLGAGACPSTGLATTITDAAGEYVFSNLAPGTYCVSYDSLSDGNDVILIPGGPTYPVRGEAGYLQTVELESGIDQLDVNFGYAWQFFN
jgi:hypothetical protein